MIGTRSTSTSSSGITAPMNINAVIAHLVEMTPPQRKQFAQMHMDDPMMLSAAKFVDNQITKQAAAMSAQRMGTAPPPVNQQVVAQMSPQPPAPQAAPMPQAAPQDEGQGQPMPEDTGIAQLPAPNMEGMADGGIVGYADTGLVQDRQPGESFAAYRQRVLEGGKLPSKIAAADNAPFPYTIGTGPFTGSRDELIRQANAELERRRGANQMPTKSPYVTDTVDLSQTPPAAAKPPAKPVAPAAPAVPVDRKETKTDKAPAKAPKEKTGIDQLRADKVESAPPSTAQATVTTAADEDYAAAYDRILKKQDDPRANMPKEIGEIQDLNTAQRTKAMALADKQEKGLKALMAERKERLAGREGRAKEQEELNPNMSLITAGLAMMQSTGKGLSGVAEGATRGVAQYMEGVKYNSAQRQKLEDARDALADLQFNQETMTNKERLAAENAYTQGSITAKNAVISTIQQREGVNAQTAGRILDIGARQNLEGQRQQFEIGMQGQREKSQERLTKMQMDNAIRAAGISASAPLATKLAFLEKIGAAPEDSALYKGFARSEQTDKETTLYAAYTKATSDPLNGEAFMKRFPDYATFKAGMSGTGGGGTINKSGWGQAVKN